MISDGWDRGDADLLRREVGRLARSCDRLIWLNPLLGSPGYRPLIRGIGAVLPLVGLPPEGRPRPLAAIRSQAPGAGARPAARR